MINFLSDAALLIYGAGVIGMLFYIVYFISDIIKINEELRKRDEEVLNESKERFRY